MFDDESEGQSNSRLDSLSRREVLKAAGAAGTAVGFTRPVAARDYDGNPFEGFGGTQCDVPRTSDVNLPFDTGGMYGGWGGHEYHCTKPGTPTQNPIVFVHGNTHDACDFSEHATQYLNWGYRGDALWSITFREPTSTHPEMRRQLDDFVTKILAYTGATTVDVVSHSLGVTGVRAWMDGGPDNEHPKRYDRVDTFIGCAGANHGTYTCGPKCGEDPGTGEPCAFISPGCADESGEPLYDLNHPDETPHDGDVDYYTIRGSADYFYLKNPESPRLEGAISNVVLEGAAHNATRVSEEAINLIYQWATDGEPVDRPEQEGHVSASGSRSDDGSAFTAGQTDEINLHVETNRPVFVRDTVPYAWHVLGEESDAVSCVAPHPHAGIRYVYFNGLAKSYDASYLVEAPDEIGETGTYEFGPVEVRPPSATEWTAVSGTTATNTVVGVSTTS